MRLVRYRSGGAGAREDRRSIRVIQRRTIDRQPLQRAVELHHERYKLIRGPGQAPGRPDHRLMPRN